MAELDKGKTVSLEELIVSTLAMTDALAKLLIEKGVITQAEFTQKLLEERAIYQRILKPRCSNYRATRRCRMGLSSRCSCSR